MRQPVSTWLHSKRPPHHHQHQHQHTHSTIHSSTHRVEVQPLPLAQLLWAGKTRQQVVGQRRSGCGRSAQLAAGRQDVRVGAEVVDWLRSSTG